ncbi:MAG: alkaline phosphatase family protein, partial [Sandaracinaceae bacterium]|nr:alkaline phosphatase family protein [Sandaracinaceae bacterium]
MPRLLVVFVDALGPEQLSRFGDGLSSLPERRSLRGIVGYSSGALATVLTGGAPRAHGRMCLFSRARAPSILAPLAWLGLLPAIVHERAWLRRQLSRALAAVHGLEGYVALHRVPPRAFAGLDLPERDDLFTTDAIGGRRTFLSRAREAGLDVAITPWQLPEEARWEHLDALLERRRPSLTFAYAAALDGALHEEGEDGPRARAARARIAEGIARARDRLGDCVTLVVGDHGMAPVDRVVDPRPFVK